MSVDVNQEDFPDTAEGWASRWKREIDAAIKEVESFWEKGDKVVDTFRSEDQDDKEVGTRSAKLNLFHANITTLRSMLYGRVPRVVVDRRYADANDDAARIAANMLERILNCDIEEAGEDYSAVLRNVLDDRLLPGLGTARVAYEFEKAEQTVGGENLDPAGNPQTPMVNIPVIADEWVDTIYVYWKDVIWSPARYWSELRWRAYRTYLTREELTKKFPEEGSQVPLNAKSPLEKDDTGKTWSKAEVWEIWDKDRKKLWWYCKDHPRILAVKSDPLQLEGFFPEPPPFVANCTTGRMIPRADYVIAQDLYIEVDTLQARIELLTQAVKVIGVYDSKSTSLQSLLSPNSAENKMVPVDTWAAFAEKGGLKGVVDFFPLEQIVNALQTLRDVQSSKIEQLYQVTGMSDILRGGALAGASATEQALKAKFASVRVQALQDEFARFATDLQCLKAEIMLKHFQPESLVKYSNISTTPDAPDIGRAIQLLKNPDLTKWKIEIKPETLAMVDYSQLRQERTEYIQALGLFLQSSGPIVEKFPEASPVLMELLKWGLAGFKGSSEIEGVIDRALAAVQQKLGQPQQPQPDPQMMKIQAEMQQSAAESQQKMQMQQQKFQMEMQQTAAENRAAMAQLITKFGLEIQKIQAVVDGEKQKQAAQTHNSVVEAALDSVRTQHEKDMGMGSGDKDNGGRT